MKSKFVAEDSSWAQGSNEALGYTSSKKKRKKVRDKRLEPKDAQTCLEVERVLNLVFSGELNDPVLRDLSIYTVESLGQGRSIMVLVAHDVVLDGVEEQSVKAHLKQAQGYLRTLVTQALNRKKVPLIQFEYVGVMPTQVEKRANHAN